jgi:hypothetical protein
MKIVTHLTPHQNTASNVSANGRKVIVEQVRKANKCIEAGEWGCVFEEILFCDEYDIFLAIIFGCQSREFSKFLVRHHFKINEILQNDNIDFNHLDCECHPFERSSKSAFVVEIKLINQNLSLEINTQPLLHFIEEKGWNRIEMELWNSIDLLKRLPRLKSNKRKM